MWIGSKEGRGINFFFSFILFDLVRAESQWDGRINIWARSDS